MILLAVLWQAEEAFIFREPRIVGFIAAMLLLVYVIAALVFYRREKAFLDSVPKAQRRWFITQDVTLQISVLLVLIPVIVHPDLKVLNGTAHLVRLLLVIGFTLLWVAALWMVFSRYRFTRTLLKDIQDKEAVRLLELKQILERELANAEDRDE